MEPNHGLRGEEVRESDRTPERELPEPASGRTPSPGNAPDLKRGWRERLAPRWVRQPFWIKVAILGSAMSVTVFLVVFAIGKLRAPKPVLLTSRLAPGPMSLRPRGPVRTVPQTPVDVAGIRSAGGPSLRNSLPPPASPPPSLGPTSSPALQPLSSAPSQTAPPSPEILERQMGAVVVEVAGIEEAVRRLEAENTALLKGQEWIERAMSRGLPSRAGSAEPDGSSRSAPLSDDRPVSSQPSSPPVLAGWRVIGVSGTGAVLVDPSGQDHLVRKGRELLGVAVTGIDPETGAVAFSDGEVLKP